MLAALHHPNSSVRAGCVDAVRSMAASHPAAVAPILLRPLASALLHEQDRPQKDARNIGGIHTKVLCARPNCSQKTKLRPMAFTLFLMPLHPMNVVLEQAETQHINDLVAANNLRVSDTQIDSKLLHQL
ncbi:hypothetical protein COCNU_04G012520 [Cocos nucifera]|uniref:Uncharacterized protein n=1 Tax=Cocos nucifera TaxID=13894 RepID=A0A8K0N0V2_COCNU|nr:hypothetical protein COCNU_04G012520 [Cocos nucifera]